MYKIGISTCVDVDCNKGVISPEYYQEFANSIIIIE